jgi:hypothetical protein
MKAPFKDTCDPFMVFGILCGKDANHFVDRAVKVRGRLHRIYIPAVEQFQEFVHEVLKGVAKDLGARFLSFHGLSEPIHAVVEKNEIQQESFLDTVLARRTGRQRLVG